LTATTSPGKFYLMSLPLKMQELKDRLEAKGWRTAVQEGSDSADHPFLTLQALSPDREHKIQATWHTRATGGKSFRLFSCMIWKPYRGWTDTNPKKIMEVLVDKEATGD
jgi:hypothetical protein